MSKLIAAGAMFFSVSTKRYLFLLRDHSSHSGTWGLPGGKIENNETVINGLMREIHEEIGKTPHINKIIPLEQYTSQNSNFIYHTYMFVIDEEFIPTLNKEHKAYAWAPLDDCPKPMHPGLFNTLKSTEIHTKLTSVEELLYLTNLHKIQNHDTLHF